MERSILLTISEKAYYQRMPLMSRIPSHHTARYHQFTITLFDETAPQEIDFSLIRTFE